VLWHVADGRAEDLYFQCRVGHRWNIDSLLEEQGSAVEAALWTALRALEDRLALSRHLADSAATAGREHSARRYLSDASELARSAEVLRELLLGGRPQTPEIAGDELNG
jgi:two-component system chemotaxis response regulator CheB